MVDVGGDGTVLGAAVEGTLDVSGTGIVDAAVSDIGAAPPSPHAAINDAATNTVNARPRTGLISISIVGVRGRLGKSRTAG
jgi:hypothetical protein